MLDVFLAQQADLLLFFGRERVEHDMEIASVFCHRIPKETRKDNLCVVSYLAHTLLFSDTYVRLVIHHPARSSRGSKGKNICEKVSTCSFSPRSKHTLSRQPSIVNIILPFIGITTNVLGKRSATEPAQSVTV